MASSRWYVCIWGDILKGTEAGEVPSEHVVDPDCKLSHLKEVCLFLHLILNFCFCGIM